MTQKVGLHRPTLSLRQEMLEHHAEEADDQTYFTDLMSGLDFDYFYDDEPVWGDRDEFTDWL